MSMAFLVNDKTPMVWRGPMAAVHCSRCYCRRYGVNWIIWLLICLQELAIYNLRCQEVAVDGAVIVTTPQDIALQDAIKRD